MYFILNNIKILFLIVGCWYNNYMYFTATHSVSRAYVRTCVRSFFSDYTLITVLLFSNKYLVSF